ncbi:MAG: AbrB/MazE/SpoVT family DNA-binding domain-containing protein [Candidatus Hydrogenedentes bacterium]|nr:AbrB/MazE/SpoVT family DNA-binding domain-containing protein [Candidatus Hydrogenedentota bacterium]
MKVTTKGQVTIPQDLREKTGIMPGCEVEFVEDAGRIYLRKLTESSRGSLLVERMSGKGSVRMTTDEILALTRGDA